MPMSPSTSRATCVPFEVLSLFLTDRFPLFQVTETRQLTKALKEVKEIAGVTKNYLVANGPQDPLFQTYCEQSEDW